MDLRPGDKVVVIDEKMSGDVISVHDDTIMILCEDGFDYKYYRSQLMKITEDGGVEFERKPFKVEREPLAFKENAFSMRITLSGKKPSVDLHIEALAPNLKFDQVHDVLIFQLEYVRQVLHIAAQKRIRNLVFVHGVGKGVLREELRRMLSSSYPSIEYFDGAYSNFGAGATEIIIHEF